MAKTTFWDIIERTIEKVGIPLSAKVRRLNNAFGIGVIKLNPENVFESEIVFPSSINQEIDWDTVNRLANENADFSNFLKFIAEDCKLSLGTTEELSRKLSFIYLFKRSDSV